MKLTRMLALLVQESNRTGSATVDWLDETKTVLIQRLKGEWTWQGCYWGLIQVYYRVMVSPHPVDFVCDLSESGSFPEALWLALRDEWLWKQSKWPKRLRRVIIIGGGEELQQLFDLRRQVAPETMQFFHAVRTYDEALALLKTWLLNAG